ncbi:MAG: VCBS repeat-containing protein [Pyrinomonadaceae bacterium]
MKISRKFFLLTGLGFLLAAVLTNTFLPHVEAQKDRGKQRASALREAAATVPVAGVVLTLQKPNVDMNGDGRTDFVITRESAPNASLNNTFVSGLSRTESRRQRLQRTIGSDSLAGAASQFEWWVAYNNVPGGFTSGWGLAQVDDTVSADFDGDATDDLAVWRPGIPGEAGFYSLDSSTGTFRYSDFGLTGDDASVVADYDGDGRDDPATFRCPEVTEGQCYFFYRGSLNNPNQDITYSPWGFGTMSDYFPSPGDFNGDGKYDFCLEDVRNTQATFWLWINGTQTYEVSQWGLNSDFLIPGDFDGDGKSDFTVMRIENDDSLVFYTHERDGGVRIVQWGVVGDIPVPGDYDGDGKQDIAIYRWNTTDATFWILPSNGDPYRAFNYGVPGDEPLAAWYVQ